MLSPRFQPQYLIVGGLLLSTTALLWLSGLSASSGYLHILGPLMLFGLGNGIAFVPLTGLSLAGVAPADAGAGSGLVNVMQQVGGTLGLAIMVSVFGHASGAASVSGTAAQQAQQAFVHGADTAFEVAAGFLALTVLLVAAAGPGPAQARGGERLRSACRRRGRAGRLTEPDHRHRQQGAGRPLPRAAGVSSSAPRALRESTGVARINFNRADEVVTNRPTGLTSGEVDPRGRS